MTVVDERRDVVDLVGARRARHRDEQKNAND
jgi:hypothetical protein